MRGIIGTAKVFGYSTNRNDGTYSTPLKRLLKGTSHGHLALELEFKREGNEDLARTYFLGNPDLHYTIEPDTYKVYFSFGPETKGHFSDWEPVSRNSMLRDALYDAETSASHDAFEYDPNVLDRFDLEPLSKIVAPSFSTNSRVTKRFSSSEINLAPTMIIHISSLQKAYGINAAEAAIKYSEAYKNWRSSLVYAQDMKFSKGPNHPITKDYEAAALRMHLKMRNSEDNLRRKMFPNESLSREAFLKKLEPFVTYGSPARDVIALPIVRDAARSGAAGLDLEAMLEYIAEVANKIKNGTIGYYIFGNNGSQMVLNTLDVGLRASANALADRQFHEGLVFPRYVRMLGLPVSPALGLQLAAKVQAELQNENSELRRTMPLRFTSATVAPEDDTESLQSSASAVVHLKDTKSWRRKIMGMKLLKFD